MIHYDESIGKSLYIAQFGALFDWSRADNPPGGAHASPSNDGSGRSRAVT